MSNGEHGADIAVAERKRLIQLAADRVQRREEPVRADLIQHHLHLFRLLARLVEKARTSEVDQHSFRTGGDERLGSGDEQMPWNDQRRRHRGQQRFAGPEVLQELEHLSVDVRSGLDRCLKGRTLGVA